MKLHPINKQFQLTSQYNSNSMSFSQFNKDVSNYNKNLSKKKEEPSKEVPANIDRK